jgi:hypothetical protein
VEEGAEGKGPGYGTAHEHVETSNDVFNSVGNRRGLSVFTINCQEEQDLVIEAVLSRGRGYLHLLLDIGLVSGTLM